jgi:hypothetical protein
MQEANHQVITSAPNTPKAIPACPWNKGFNTWASSSGFRIFVDCSQSFEEAHLPQFYLFQQRNSFHEQENAIILPSSTKVTVLLHIHLFSSKNSKLTSIPAMGTPEVHLRHIVMSREAPLAFNVTRSSYQFIILKETEEDNHLRCFYN